MFVLQALWLNRRQSSFLSTVYPLVDFLLFFLVALGFFLVADQVVPYKPLFVLATAGLLVTMRKNSPLGRLLSHPFSLALGISSYSLYLWHWPLIVLLRWTLGINMFTFAPLILAIALSTRASYWVETKFRFGDISASWQKQPLVVYPFLTILTAFFVAGISKFASSALFLGDASRSPQNFTVRRSIRGTTVNTANCFLDPEAPLQASANDKCQAGENPNLPTLFFEGDSVSHSLIPMLERLYESKNYNISFFGRGSCITPFVKPWPGERHLLTRYKNCPEHAQIRERAVLAKIKPGDQVVLVTTNAYVQGQESQANYLEVISRLATTLEAKGAGLILFSPFPDFAQRTSIKTPLSLCFQEWFRPAWALPQDCNPATVDSRGLLEYANIMKNLQAQLKQKHRNIRVFDLFPILCPPGKDQCSTHLAGTMMFYDGIHLTASGGRYLYPAFQSFLRAVP